MRFYSKIQKITDIKYEKQDIYEEMNKMFSNRLIVVDEFKSASELGSDVDSNIIELLQMSITGIVGVVAGYVSGKSK